MLFYHGLEIGHEIQQQHLVACRKHEVAVK
jgi:hypothetical protein